jgi:hypothetical protein
MEIDYKLIIPLVGVILGWFLGTISGYFKIRGENKRLLGKSISQLYYFIHELSIVMHYLDKMKDNLSIEKYEIHRQKVIEKYTLKNEHSIKNINELIDSISSMTPLLGIELKYVLEGYLSGRNTKFNSSKKDKELYFVLLSIYEVNQDLTIAQMERILVKLSFRYNIFLGFKIQKRLKRKNINLKQVGTEMFDVIKSEIDKIDNPNSGVVNSSTQK